MEEKKIKIRNSIRTISNFRGSFNFLFRSSNLSKDHGFTLVEIIVVIAMIGILAAATLALINPVAQLQRSRDSKRKADLKQIQTALELYRSDNDSYPEGAANSVANCGESLGDPSCNTTYIQTVPKDPKGMDYYYELNGNGYYIYACSENSSNDADDMAAPAAVRSHFGSSCPTVSGSGPDSGMRVYRNSNP